MITTDDGDTPTHYNKMYNVHPDVQCTLVPSRVGILETVGGGPGGA